MTKQPMPFATLVSFESPEEEETRIFTRAFIADSLREERPRHRYVAISIPAFLDDEEPKASGAPSAWARLGTALMWGSTVSIIGAALAVAFAG